VSMISSSVEISIADGGEEMVRAYFLVGTKLLILAPCTTVPQVTHHLR